MSLPLALYHLTAFVAIGMACYALSKWGSPRTLYFTCYAISVAVYAVGTLLQVTAGSLPAAIVAYKVEYFGIPFIAVFFFLFSMDYSDRPVRKRWLVLALMAFPMLCTILVNSWPLTDWFCRDLQLVDGRLLNYLAITPGPLYYVANIYYLVLMLAGTGLILRYFARNGRPALNHLVVFLAAASFPLIALVLKATGVADWDIMPISLAAHSLLLGLYVIRFRRTEWAMLGRERVVEQMKDAFVLIDTQGGYLDSNQAAAEYFPELAKLVPGVPVRSITGFPQSLMSGSGDTEFTLEMGETQRFMRASRSPLEVGGQVKGTSIVMFDDTENHNLLDELQQMATHDALTGLYNRGSFFRYATRDFDLSRRKKQDGSVLMMDIDHFKKVNDQYGHQAGDKVLLAIANILRARLRHTDISGRYGGEELSVWLPDAAGEGAAIIADVIRRAVEHTVFESEDGSFHVTISIGVAGLNHARHENFEQLVAEADVALYRAKREGRNRVCIYAPPVFEEAEVTEVTEAAGALKAVDTLNSALSDFIKSTAETKDSRPADDNR